MTMNKTKAIEAKASRFPARSKLDTLTLVRAFKALASKHWLSPMAERKAQWLEGEIKRRAAEAAQLVGI